ncbi:MAG: hypothetical protein JXJ18_09755 [Rhodobacteraceae bacterium]|nr:hypothetical protein [Paracoccaceae bacterium]
MQIFGPFPVVGVSDGALTTLAQTSTRTRVTPVPADDGATAPRSETGRRGQTPPRAEFPAPDPDRPTGPPPSFDTTPLEAVQERQRADAANLWRADPEPVIRRLDIEL